jgi:Fe-S cluster assembly protein SufD
MEESVNLQISSPSLSAVEKLTEAYRRVAPGLPGSERWIADLRASGVETLGAFGLPHRRVEQWKYTDLRALLTDPYEPASGPAPLTQAELDERLGALAGVPGLRAVFVNGYFVSDLSEMSGCGLEFASLSDALASPPVWLSGALGSANPVEGDAVSALNAAFMTGGAVIRVADGARTEPIHLIHVTMGDAPLSAAVRNIVLVGGGAETSLIETFLSHDDAVAAQTIAVTELILADGARANCVKASLENEKTLHLGGVHARLGAGSVYEAVQFSAGGSACRHQSFIRFTGEGARVNYAGGQMLRGRQHCDATLIVDHAAPGCQSRELLKAVIDDSARGVFQGKVVVRPGAQKTDGRQMAQGLLLSETAEFDSKPELEIYADDVACGHGSTAGELDADLLFYLRARGVPEAEARALMIMAFVGEALDNVADEALRDALMATAAAWLNNRKE